MNSRPTESVCQDEGTGVESIKDDDVKALPLEERYDLVVP